MKTEKRYCRIRYNKDTDSFELQTRTSKGYYDDSYVLSCKCLRAENQPADTDPEMIHYTIIAELNNAVRMGYIFEA